jgi:predicted DNA binding CopG/RHH family protein
MKAKEAMKEAKRTRKAAMTTERSEVEAVRVGISLRVDLEVLQALKARAVAEGLPYQTLINSILTKYVKSPSLDERVRAIEDQIKKHG